MTKNPADPNDLKEHDERILGALYELYPNGCGYNQLRMKARVNKKVLDVRLRGIHEPRSLVHRPGSLVHSRYITVKTGRTTKSRYSIKLTKFGRDQYIEHVAGKVDDAFKLVTALPEPKMNQAMRLIMNKVFTDLVKPKRSPMDLERLHSFLMALQEPYMDVVNKPFRTKDLSRPFCAARFITERFPWHWLRTDAALAVKRKHWLSPARAQLLSTLGDYSKEYLEKHNREWLNRMQREGLDPLIQKDEEYDNREPEIRKRHPEAFDRKTTTLWHDLKYY